MGMITVALWGLNTTATTRQGVDFTVSTYRIPLYLKVLSFFDRDAQYRVLARNVTQGLTSERVKILAIYDWTRAHIRPTPPDLPIVDDHPLHIIIRGYGEPDQMADVFTTLATYAGIPAFANAIMLREGNGTTGKIILSFARIDDRWTVFDVARGLRFTDANGQLIDARELALHPEFVAAVAGSAAPYGIPYAHYVDRLQPFRVPQFLRAQKQMPLPRLVLELKRFLHLEAEADTGA